MNLLPEPFRSLEPYSAWCLATETERNTRRVNTRFDEIVEFANAVLPRVDDIAAYVDQRALEGDLPEDAKNLFYMMLSLAEVAPAIECYDPQATVIDGYETGRFVPNETHALRPKI